LFAILPFSGLSGNKIARDGLQIFQKPILGFPDTHI